jgi:uncharacterized damage-inducible protein DinB
MSNSQNLIAELEHELISAGKLLELVPAELIDFKPNPKAMTLGQLANHVAVIPVRYLTFAEDGFTDLGELTHHHVPKGKEEFLNNFKTGSEKAKLLLKNIDHKWQGKSWSLTKNGSPVLTLPIELFVRLLVFNHFYHHRGQLSAYLRALNVPLPSIYGPSADENPFA